MFSADAEDLIAHFSRQLAPADRTAFRRAAEAAVASAPPCSWGPGSLHRALVPLWRNYFHPPAKEEAPGWDGLAPHRPRRMWA